MGTWIEVKKILRPQRAAHAEIARRKVILARRLKPSAALGEPRFFTQLFDQETGAALYKSALKLTSAEADGLAEIFAKRRNLDIVSRV